MVREEDHTAEDGPDSADSMAPDGPLARVADQKPAIAGEGRALVIGCGALARELVATTA